MKRSVRYILIFLVLAALAGYVWHARADFGQLIVQIDGTWLAGLVVPMLAVPLLSLWANASIGRLLAAELGVALGPFEAYALSTVNALGNYLPLPQAGAVARGVYLKRRHNLPWGPYASSVIVTFVSSLALSGVLGLGGLVALQLAGKAAPWQLWVAFALLAGSAVLFTRAGARVPLPGRLKGFADGLAALRRHHVLARVLVLQLTLIGLTATGLWLSCLALPGGRSVPWMTALMFGLVGTVTAVVNILGVEQAATALAAHLLGIDPELGFLASALFRAAAITVVFTTGPVLANWLAKRTEAVEGEAGVGSSQLKVPS